MAQHIIPPRTYYAVFAALIVLTFLTVGVSFLNLGDWHTIVGLAIAVCKATLVVLIFMHLWYSSRLTWVIALAALYFLGIMLGLTLTDYGTRWKMLF
jgi:cytochrome c oxidase subunit 4